MPFALALPGGILNIKSGVLIMPIPPCPKSIFPAPPPPPSPLLCGDNVGDPNPRAVGVPGSDVSLRGGGEVGDVAVLLVVLSPAFASVSKNSTQSRENDSVSSVFSSSISFPLPRLLELPLEKRKPLVLGETVAR